MVLEPHQVKTYRNFLKFFQDTIGIVRPLRETIPHKEILNELRQAKEKGFNDVGKGIIAKHALLSFFPHQLRKNSLLIIYVYKKLSLGETPLTNRSIVALTKYYASIETSLRNKIKKHSDLADAMLQAINLLLPDEKVDFYFNNYLKRLIFWKDTLLEDDYNLLDAIIDDFWISHNWKYSSDEICMIFTLSQLFSSQKKPFSLQFFLGYVKENRDYLLKKYGSCVWINDETHLSTIWNKFSSQGINFSYSVNTRKLGLVPINFMIQVHPNTGIEMLRFSLEICGNNHYMFENWSQNSLIIFGLIYVPDIDIESITSFFERLKNIGTIQDYLLISGKGYHRGLSQFLHGIQELEASKPGTLWGEDNKNGSVQFDAIDNLFLQNLRRIGFTGFPLDEVSKFTKTIKSNLGSQISSLKTLLFQVSSIGSYLQKDSERLKIIIPKCYYTSEIRTIDDYLNNSNLSIIENLFFFEKWHQILSQISIYKSMKDFRSFEALNKFNPTLFINIRNEIRIIKKFVISSYHNIKKPSDTKQPYSTKKLLNILIQDKNSVKILAELVSDLKVIILLLKTKLNSNAYDSEIISFQISQLVSIDQLSDVELQNEFENRLQNYIDNDIITPNLMYSVVLGNRGYVNCSFFKEGVPKEVRENWSRTVRKQFFSITDNFLGEWDIDYGEIQPNEIKRHWLISQNFKIQNASFMEIPFDPLYHYDNLYDFSVKKFTSIMPMMKCVLNFCSTHLKNPQRDKKEQYSSFLNTIETPSDEIDWNDKKILRTSLKLNHLKTQKEENIDIQNITRIFQEAQQKNTSVFLSPENSSMKEIQIEINWPKIGLEEYIVSYKVRKEKFSHKSLPHSVNTREFLCVPGIKEIYCSSDTEYFQNTFIHYVFPFHSPPYNIFHSLERWNYVENLQIMRIKSKKISFNDQFLDNNSTGFRVWELAANRFITGSLEEHNVDAITFEYSPGQKIFGKNSPQFHTLKTIYGKNMRRLKNLPVYEKIEKLFKSEIIWFTPNLDQLYPLPLRIVIQLYPLNQEQLKLFNMLFIAAPVSIQYLVEFEQNNKVHEGLFVDLRFHTSNISELLYALQKAVRYYKIKNFRVIPSIIPITKGEYVGHKLKNYPVLFDSFIWKDNRFKNIKIMSQTGFLDYKERYNQLK